MVLIAVHAGSRLLVAFCCSYKKAPALVIGGPADPVRGRCRPPGNRRPCKGRPGHQRRRALARVGRVRDGSPPRSALARPATPHGRLRRVRSIRGRRRRLLRRPGSGLGHLGRLRLRRGPVHAVALERPDRRRRSLGGAGRCSRRCSGCSVGLVGRKTGCAVIDPLPRRCCCTTVCPTCPVRSSPPVAYNRTCRS